MEKTSENPEDYAFRDIEEYENITKRKTNEAFRMGWDVARWKNKHIGIGIEKQSKKV